MDKISTNVAPKPLNGFRRNMEYRPITTSWVWRHMQMHVALRQRGWSWQARFGFLVNLSFSVYSLARTQPNTGSILTIY